MRIADDFAAIRQRMREMNGEVPSRENGVWEGVVLSEPTRVFTFTQGAETYWHFGTADQTAWTPTPGMVDPNGQPYE